MKLNGFQVAHRSDEPLPFLIEPVLRGSTCYFKHFGWLLHYTRMLTSWLLC